MTDHPCQEAPARPYYGRNDVYVAQAIDESPEWLGRVLGYLSIQPDGCWLWTRSKTADGYGRVCLPAKVKRTSVLVHRLVWIALRGHIAAGLVLDHDSERGCRNRACANPDHLEPVTNRHNSVITASGGTAAEYSRRTHCSRGHRLEHDPQGSRKCRHCAAARYQARNDLIREAARAAGMSQVAYRSKYGTTRAAALGVLGEAS